MQNNPETSMDVVRSTTNKTLMEDSEKKYLEKLRNAYTKRLRMLELRQARLGLNVPIEIEMEIEEIKNRIVSIDRELSVEEKQVPNASSQQSNIQTDESRLVAITLPGNLKDLNPLIEQAIIRALAALLEIQPEEIMIRKKIEGSVILEIMLPKDAAEKLIALYEDESQSIKDLDILHVQLVSYMDDRSSEPQTDSQGTGDSNITSSVPTDNTDGQKFPISEDWDVIEDGLKLYRNLTEDRRLEIRGVLGDLLQDPSRIVAVILKDAGPNKVQVAKILEEVMELNKQSASSLVDKVPEYIARSLLDTDPRLTILQRRLESAGATIEIRRLQPEKVLVNAPHPKSPSNG